MKVTSHGHCRAWLGHSTACVRSARVPQVRRLPVNTWTSAKVVTRMLINHELQLVPTTLNYVCSSEEHLIILVQERENLYSLQKKDYDNSLAKDSCWKEIIGKVHTRSKEQAVQYFVRHTQAYLCHRQRSALPAEKHFVGGSLPMARQPKGV